LKKGKKITSREERSLGCGGGELGSWDLVNRPTWGGKRFTRKFAWKGRKGGPDEENESKFKMKFGIEKSLSSLLGKKGKGPRSRARKKKGEERGGSKRQKSNRRFRGGERGGGVLSQISAKHHGGAILTEKPKTIQEDKGRKV